VIRVYAALLLMGAIHHERRASTARLSLQVAQVLPVRAKVGGSISDPQSVQSGVGVSVVGVVNAIDIYTSFRGWWVKIDVCLLDFCSCQRMYIYVF